MANGKVSVFPDDTFIVSYPRSGNTWLRFMLAEIITGIEINFENIENIIPDIYKNRDSELRKMNRPRVLKSHESFDERYPKVIYIVRDVRDVVVSYYFYWMKFYKNKLSLSQFLDNFTSKRLDGFIRWDEHVKSWIGDRRSDNEKVLSVRYEDLKTQTMTEIIKITDFMGIKTDSPRVNRVIEANELQRMQVKEKQNILNVNYLRRSNQSIKFIRQGKIGSFKDILTIADQKTLIAEFGSTLEKLGYNLG